ncbi:kinase-like protein [Aspergillus heteromorphus CBS 117.55]|uniref:non-specific serine/threonine protein kinase n=1 Tax=Aspergillus heteromorphus CBS 117.55 TaxID=1448321 RepID=A0A317X0I2_9EURO|nr:kinase-like protein [Aspergillus heteromorphus CBS 117.55]PWY92146.1 kinase-like protein [Aspergillus heteromorphus CBS 117.55]
MTQGRRIEYNWIRDVETLENYEPGGYHPIMVGKMLHGRYYIADKLGHGEYSTVWLAHDTHLKRYVALKVNMASTIPREPKVLRALSASPDPSSPEHTGHGLVSDLLDEFEVQGPNGTHRCYTVTLAACSLRDTLFNCFFPLEIARALSYGLTWAVAHIHSRGYVHGDIYLNNALLKLPSNFDDLSIEQFYKKYGEPETVPITQCSGEPLPPNVPAKAVLPLFLGKTADKLTLSEARLLLSDFGEAFAPASEIRLGKDCHTPLSFRAPEIKFELEGLLTYSSDIWSLATAIWDIIGLHPIFNSNFVTEDELVCQYIDVLGPMPSEWWLRWEGRSQFFSEDGQSTEYHQRNKRPPLKETFENDVQKWRRKRESELGEDEAAAFLDLMRRMLVFRPEGRLTADEVLQSEWMVKWALPDYNRSLKDSL